MSCNVGEVTVKVGEWASLYISISMSSAYSPTFPSLHLRHSSFSNTSVALPTLQLILQPSVALPTSPLILKPFFRFSYVTGSSLTSLGEPPMQNNTADHLTLVPFKSKFIIFVAYFNTSMLICNLARSIIGCTTYSTWPFQCADWLSAKLLRMSLIHEKVRYLGPLLWIRMASGWDAGSASDMQGKDGEKPRS